MLRKMGSLRAGLLALAALAAFGAGIAILLATRTGSSGQEPSTRVEQRATGPAGQPGPVTVIVPNYPANPGQSVTQGAFRILPFGYSDPANSTAIPLTPCASPRADVADPALVAASGLAATVGYIPAGFTDSPPVASVVCGPSVQEIKWVFHGKGASSVEIVRGRARLPFDVRTPPIDSWNTLEAGSVNGLQAVFLRNKPGQFGPQSIYFVEGNMLTIINGDVFDFSELLKVAESLRK